MNYLNERIVFGFSGQDVTPHNAGMYVYKIFRKKQTGGDADLLFVGKFYYNGTDNEITFDVTDIIASDGFVVKAEDFELNNTIQNKIVNKYTVEITWAEDDVITSNEHWVAKVYKYPNKNLDNYTIFFTPDYIGYQNYVSNLLQGFARGNRDSKLLPHYPMFSDVQSQEENACPFGLSLLVGNGITNPLNLTFVIGDSEYNSYKSIPVSGNSFSYLSKVGKVADYLTEEIPMRDGVLSITDGQFIVQVFEAYEPSRGTWLYRRYPDSDLTSGVNRYAYVLINNSNDKDVDDNTIDIDDLQLADIIYSNSPAPELHEEMSGSIPYIVDDIAIRGKFVHKVGILDICPKRYYLFWQDRYGSFQCQPFNDYAKYTETFDRYEIQDYQNRRRNANIYVQSKWKINSGWITEELYPYYESIYISPILILYDSQSNKTINVMVSGDYEEKTYKNQKKLINMSLELTENKKQNIIY